MTGFSLASTALSRLDLGAGGTVLYRYGRSAEPPGASREENDMVDYDETDETSTEQTFESNLQAALEGHQELSIRSIRTFEEDGLMTRDRGLVIRLADGREYQLTIQDSTR